MKSKKTKQIKNQMLWRKGGLSIAITALVIAIIVGFNILIGAIADRFVLEYDMTADKKHSISNEDNIEFIKKVNEEITITVCSNKEDYVNYIYATATNENYGYQMPQEAFANNTTVEYINQTQTLLEKYVQYNNKLKLEYVSPDSSAFAEIQTKYKNLVVEPGGIIVGRVTENGNARYRTIGFDDVYALKANEEYAAYGYTVYESVEGNNLETALTNAIAYVANDTTKQAAMLIGHSDKDYTERYRKNLENNNFEVTVIEDKHISKIDSKYDVIVIPGPSRDFAKEEISAISKFLDNDEELGKGMVVFADAKVSYLTNFYDFLKEWGADIKDGIAYEMNDENCVSLDPTTFRTNNFGVAEGFDGFECISGNNVPLGLAFEKQDYMQAAVIMGTYYKSVVAAPKNMGDDWAGADEDKATEHASVIESVKSNYNSKDEEIESRVAVFSSIDFLDSAYSTAEGVYNDNVALAMTERVAGISEFGYSYIPKEITSTSFLEQVTESGAKTIRIIFMIVVPLVIIAVAVFVYFKRRNAE